MALHEQAQAPRVPRPRMHRPCVENRSAGTPVSPIMNLRRTLLLTTVAAAISVAGAGAVGAVAPPPGSTTPPETNAGSACVVIRRVYVRSIAHGGEDGARAAANAERIWGLSGCEATYGPITNWI